MEEFLFTIIELIQIFMSTENKKSNFKFTFFSRFKKVPFFTNMI